MTSHRPTSPLNPRVERQGMRRDKSPSLRLTGLPRFHPANFPSVNPSSNGNSALTSPVSTQSSPAGTPLALPTNNLYVQNVSSTHHRSVTSDPSRQLHNQQRDAVNLNRYHATRVAPASPGAGGMSSTPVNSSRVHRPSSPRLDPLGSPGPVTPLELEERDGYLFPRTPSPSQANGSPDEMRESERTFRPTSPIPIPIPGPGTRYSPRSATTARMGDGRGHRVGASR